MRSNQYTEIELVGNGRIPEYKNIGDGGADVYLPADVILNPGEIKTVGSGIKIMIPHGFDIYLLPRSSMFINRHVTQVNSPALIDNSYRGEIKLIIKNNDKFTVLLKKGERICQIKLVRQYLMDFVEVDKICKNTFRSEFGTGSTGL